MGHLQILFLLLSPSYRQTLLGGSSRTQSALKLLSVGNKAMKLVSVTDFNDPNLIPEDKKSYGRASLKSLGFCRWISIQSATIRCHLEMIPQNGSFVLKPISSTLWLTNWDKVNLYHVCAFISDFKLRKSRKCHKSLADLGIRFYFKSVKYSPSHIFIQ